MSQKGFAPIFILTGILVIVGLFAGVYYFERINKRNFLLTQQNLDKPTTQSIPTPINDSPKINRLNDSFRDLNSPNQVLISMIPNFDNLSFYDLPNFQDVREVSQYKGNLIIAGIDRVIEYNPNNKSIIWQNNNRKLRSIHYVALIGDYLYISTDRFPGSQSDPISQKLIKVDLKTGKIIQSFFEDDKRKLMNMRLFSVGSYIWGTTEVDGVFRLNPENDDIEFFTFQEATNIKEFKDVYYSKVGKINLQLSDFELDLPTFMVISPRIISPGSEDRYYLFSKNAAYTLDRGGFPILQRKTNTFESVSFDSRVFISKNQKYALLIRSGIGGFLPENPTIGITLFAVLIDLHSGESFDLLKDHPNSKQALTKYWEDKLYKINYVPGVKFEETDNGVTLKENDTKKEILFVNFLEKKLEFK